VLLLGKKRNQQFGFTIIETASIAFILASLSYVIFTLGQAFSLRHEVNQSVSEILHLQNRPMMRVSFNNQGIPSYETQSDAVSETTQLLSTHGKELIEKRNFLRNRPYRIDAAVVFGSIDEESGSFNGFESIQSTSHSGELSVPQSILQDFSISKILEDSSRNSFVLQSFAESSMGIVYEEGHKNFIPRLPLQIVCLYIQDTGSIKAIFGSTYIPDGIIAQCDIKKGRTVL
jgi:hypothetical protein